MSFILLEPNFDLIEYQNAFFIFGIFIAIIFIFWLLANEHFDEKAARFKTKVNHPELSRNVHHILMEFFPYYVDLNVQLKKEFVKRVETFIGLKQFIPRQCETNDTINLLIAATAVQLTFGLNDFSLYLFNKILIYPSSYYSNIRNSYHKGEVNVNQRLIVLSAEHFLDGVKDSSDGINLGLHEFAHALHIHTFEKRAFDFIENFKRWKALAEIEMLRIGSTHHHLLRKYATTNISEMFAVCTENFFEKPAEFKSELPEMYTKLVVLFNQDPLLTRNPLKYKRKNH